MTNQPTATSAVWIDGDPLMEAIAAAVWEHCARDDEDMPHLVCDDPRTIAAWAAAVARAQLSAAAPATGQTAAPVKQRADCTETEWAEQERARFERLYTRETVRADLAEQRADTAARDADIYQKRLERLGDGYTRERKRAERAEAEVERLRTDRTAACICGHTEAQHFEDACLVCDCGDYLTPGAAREVIARQRKTADHAGEFTAADLVAALRGAGAERDKIEAQARAADRAAVLEEAADFLRDAYFRDGLSVQEIGTALRRMAAESVPAVAGRADNETHACGNCEGIDPHSCLMNPDRRKRPPMDPVHILGIGADEPPTGGAQQPETEAPCCSDPTCRCNQVNAAGRCDCANWDSAPAVQQPKETGL